MRIDLRYILFAALTALAASACVREEFEGFDDPTEVVAFSTRLEDLGSSGEMTRSVGDHLMVEMSEWTEDLPGAENATTRCMPTTTLSGDASLYCYQYETTINPTTDAVFEDHKYKFDGESMTPYTPYAWTHMDTDKKVRFFSFAPYEGGSSMNRVLYSGNSSGFVYTVPTTPEDQIDYLYAASSEITAANFKKVVPLQFRHALTAIQFKMAFKDATVKSITVSGVNSRGTFTFTHALGLNKWAESDTPADYTISFAGAGKAITQEGQFLVDGEKTLMMIPQDFASDSQAKVILVFTDTEGEHTLQASLAGSSWVMGKKIVYTLHKQSIEAKYIFFDLSCGSVTINATSYEGYINVANQITTLSGSHSVNNRYYIYQSLPNNTGSNYWKNQGYASAEDVGIPEKVRLPVYPQLKIDGKVWGDYITNNNDVTDVTNKWNDNYTSTGRASVSDKKITISGTGKYDVTIDNVFINSGSNTLTFDAAQAGVLTLRVKGDNRFNHIHYNNSETAGAGKFIVTSADGDGATSGTLTVCTLTPNALARDNLMTFGPSTGQDSYGLTFNGATTFVGNPVIDNCVWGERTTFRYSTVLGGGINHLGQVTINGGRLTALAHGTSPAIGGGGGYQSAGGPGLVTITGGEVYAYARGVYSTMSKYEAYVPASAIGGSGAFMQNANNGTVVNITGGYVYAESLGGTAIGGGNSMAYKGGDAEVNISGDAIVVSKSVSGFAYNGTFPVAASTSIGGGSSIKHNGGDAVINISGGRLTTGSIGGGSTQNSTRKIGTANITISGSAVISGQFVMAKGAAVSPSFVMTGGLVYNNDTDDEYVTHVKDDGGAVYMEDGTCTISGGIIRNCSAREGGAVYITGGSFLMTGGTLTKNSALKNGGAVAVSGGNVELRGGTVSLNLAKDGNGGGICVTGGGLTMTDGSTAEITGNAAHSIDPATNTGNGGGVYVSSSGDVSAQILSGTVSGNTSDTNGGGICIDTGSGSNTATITIGKSGGTPASPYIYGNSAALSGGGLCVLGANSLVTIYSGTVKGDVSAYVKNPDIRIDGGTVTLAGNTTNCNVKYNTVNFHSNNGKGDSAEQRIVTHTNSRLTPPSVTSSWTKEFNTQKEWNTKADGSGISYPLSGGDIMNISEDVDLYMIWKENQVG